MAKSRDKRTTPTCEPDVARTVASPIVVLFRALALLHRMGSTRYKKRRRSLMKRQWTDEELADDFTLSSKELDLIGDSKTDHTLLGFAALLKYFQFEGRFPAQKQDVPPVVILHLAQQLDLVPEKIIPYDWEGRTIKAHRAAIRRFL